MWPLRCSGIGYYCVSLDWEELGRTVGWSPMEAISSPLGNSSHSFWPFEVGPQASRQPFFMGLGWEGAVPAKQMHYNESRGYSGAQEEEESTGSAPVALDLSGPRSWKTQG